MMFVSLKGKEKEKKKKKSDDIIGAGLGEEHHLTYMRALRREEKFF
jgi:hypothetical protein